MLAVAAAAAAPATTAAASPGAWATQKTGNPLVPNGTLVAAACPSPTTCVAVGSFDNAANAQTGLAEVRDSGTWHVQPITLPAGATTSALSAVACPASNRCIAAGRSSAGTLAESWNGTTWSPETTPNPAGSTDVVLDGVSCASVSVCVAVGSDVNGSGDTVPLAERWNGTVWTIQQAPGLGSSNDSALAAVACSAANACIAVGSGRATTGDFTVMSELWNGSSWKLVAAAVPPATNFSDFNGVSCPSTSACTAVGSFDGSIGNPVTLAESWNGTSWKMQATPDPSGASTATLASVSCTSTGDCFAVGSSSNGTLAESRTGTAWTIDSSPNPSNSIEDVLDGVACTSATACVAAGGDLGSSGYAVVAAESWNGTDWALQAIPNPTGATTSSLQGVSCISSTDCLAVGAYGAAEAEVALSETWNGVTWKLGPGAKLADGSNASLLAVSCTAPSACTAAGSYNSSSGARETLVETWNGTVWSLQPTPDPMGTTFSELFAISCVGPASCIAVGSYLISETELTIAEMWNGTSWTIVTTPNPTGASFSVLNAVSCTSATSCVAVGNSFASGSESPLAESWNGTNWTIRPSPEPAGGSFGSLDGVSCASATACAAVGDYTDSSDVQVTLAESWNGTSWKIKTTPNPAGGSFIFLEGVSCAKSTACTAVGSYHDSAANPLTLAEVWNGASWKIQVTPNPAGGTFNSLNAVDCPSANTCETAGNYRNAAGVQVTLAEGES